MTRRSWFKTITGVVGSLIVGEETLDALSVVSAAPVKRKRLCIVTKVDYETRTVTFEWVDLEVYQEVLRQQRLIQKKIDDEFAIYLHTDGSKLRKGAEVEVLLSANEPTKQLQQRTCTAVDHVDIELQPVSTHERRLDEREGGDFVVAGCNGQGRR